MSLEQERQQDATTAAFKASGDGLYDEFMQPIFANQLSKIARYAPMTRDFDHPSPDRPMRYQTVAEVIAEVVDYPGAPSLIELIQLVRDVGYNGKKMDDLQHKARAMLRALGEKFAELNASEEI